MKNTMKKQRSAVAICALLILALASPSYAGKACSAGFNLKNCVSSIDLNSISFTDQTLAVSGVLKAINAGATAGRILSVVASLQTKDKGGQYTTIATVTAPCGTGLSLDQALPLTVPGGPGDVCSGPNLATIGFTATFSGVSLVSGKPARLELLVTFDGAANGSAGELCGATPACGTSREIAVRFGFVVP